MTATAGDLCQYRPRQATTGCCSRAIAKETHTNHGVEGSRDAAGLETTSVGALFGRAGLVAGKAEKPHLCEWSYEQQVQSKTHCNPSQSVFKLTLSPKLRRPTARPPRTTAKWSHERKVRLRERELERTWSCVRLPTHWRRRPWARHGRAVRCAVVRRSGQSRRRGKLGIGDPMFVRRTMARVSNRGGASRSRRDGSSSKKSIRETW